MVESYRLASDPLLLDIMHILLAQHYVVATSPPGTSPELTSFWGRLRYRALQTRSTHTDFAISAPSAAPGANRPSPSMRTSADVESADLAKLVALMQYIRSTPAPSDVNSARIPVLAQFDGLFTDIYIDGFIAPFTGETAVEAKGRIESVPTEDRYVAAMVESYRLASDPLLLDIMHILLAQHYVSYFTTGDLAGANKFLGKSEIQSLADVFDPSNFAIAAPSETVTPEPTPTTIPMATTTQTVAELVASVRHSVVQIITPFGSGSGFVIDSDGRVVTNDHVVAGHGSVTVRLSSGVEHQADVLGVDQVADLAIVDMTAGRNFQFVPLGNSDLVLVGSDAIALGFPLGASLGDSLTVTRGIVSSFRVFNGVKHIQTDAAINPGNNGGPLMSMAGEVIGVNTSRIEDDQGRTIQGIAFAVAVNELKDRLESLKQGQNVLVETPTPGTGEVSTTTDWSWDRWEADDSSWSISIPPGWSYDSDNSSVGYDQFGSAGELAVVGIAVSPNLGADGIHSLDAFAQSWKFATESWGAETYPSTFSVTSFEKETDRGDREFYSLEFEYFSTFVGCWIYNREHIFVDSDYGSVISGSICGVGSQRPSEEDWGSIPEILDSFELHHYSSPYIYRNNRYGYSLEEGDHYYLSTNTEDHDFAFFWGYEGQARVAFLRVWTFEAMEGYEYVLEDFAKAQRDYVSDYAQEQGFLSFEFESLTKFSETSPVDGVTRQWCELKYQEHTVADECVSDVTELLTLKDSRERGDIAYVVAGGVCEEHLGKWGPRRDAALDSFRP